MTNERELKRVISRLMRNLSWTNICKLSYMFGIERDFIDGYDDGECIGNEPFNS